MQSNYLNWESLLLSLPITFGLTAAIALILKSALRKDSQVLDYLRESYRQRWRKARMSLRSGYQPVARPDIDPKSALKREVAW
jgi:hypothetical protein